MYVCNRCSTTPLCVHSVVLHVLVQHSQTSRCFAQGDIEMGLGAKEEQAAETAELLRLALGMYGLTEYHVLHKADPDIKAPSPLPLPPSSLATATNKFPNMSGPGGLAHFRSSSVHAGPSRSCCTAEGCPCDITPVASVFHIPPQSCAAQAWKCDSESCHESCAQALLAWSDSVIVVAFRGTASMRNVVQDLQVRASACLAQNAAHAGVTGVCHSCGPGGRNPRCACLRVGLAHDAPTAARAAAAGHAAAGACRLPARLARQRHCRCRAGRPGAAAAGEPHACAAHARLHHRCACAGVRPCIRAPLDMWHALCRACMQASVMLASGSGHSLGGALATLAAYDIQARFEAAGLRRLHVFTFGAPRAGNHAFARWAGLQRVLPL